MCKDEKTKDSERGDFRASIGECTSVYVAYVQYFCSGVSGERLNTYVLYYDN